MLYYLIRVRRGVAAQHPKKYNLDENELERVSALTRVGLDELKAQIEKAQSAVISNDDDAEETLNEKV